MQAEMPVARVLLDPEAGRPANLQTSIPGLVWAFRILPDGSPEPLAIDQPIQLPQGGLLWLHFNLADARALQWLGSSVLEVPAAARTLLVSSDNYQQLHAHDDAVY